MNSLRIAPIIATAYMLSGTIAQAETRDFGSAGDYVVFGRGSTRDEAGSCLATFEYEGPGSTKTALLRSVGGEDEDIVYLTVTNFEWSAEKDARYELSYSFDNGTYERNTWGVEIDYIYKGFTSGFPADEFLSTYAKSSSLRIYKGDTLVDNLSLTGSTAGIALFNKCWTWLVGTERAARAERDRFKDLPRDPFAKSSSSTGESD